MSYEVPQSLADTGGGGEAHASQNIEITLNAWLLNVTQPSFMFIQYMHMY